jgi:hypothetical protein
MSVLWVERQAYFAVALSIDNVCSHQGKQHSICNLNDYKQGQSKHLNAQFERENMFGK